VFSSPPQWSTGLDSISTSFLHLLIGVRGLLFMLFVNLPGSLRQPCDGTKVALGQVGLAHFDGLFRLILGAHVRSDQIIWVDPRGILPEAR
jgi:hypothetical protein